MRIVGNIDHPQYKITVLEMNGKLALKIENNLLEQTYKFRNGSGIEKYNDVLEFIDDTFINQVENCFQMMAKARSNGLQSGNKGEYEFEEII